MLLLLLLSHFSRVQLFATLWTVLPGSSVHGIFQVRILAWLGISYSRVSSQPRNRKLVSCIGRQILYLCAAWEAPLDATSTYKNDKNPMLVR